MPEVLLPCSCLLTWDETEISLIICVRHLNNYNDISSGLAAIEFIKMIANPRGSQLTSELASNMR